MIEDNDENVQRIVSATDMPQEIKLTKPMLTPLLRTVVAAIVVSLTLCEFMLTGVVGWGLYMGLNAIGWMAVAMVMDGVFPAALNQALIDVQVHKAIGVGLLKALDNKEDLFGTNEDEDGLTQDQEDNDGNTIH